MTAYTRGLRQKATYWSPGAPDGEGGIAYGNPVVISCRWQDKSVLFRNAQGQEETSSSIVYPDRELSIRGLLAEGDLSDDFSSEGWLDPETLYGAAREIRGRDASPSYHGSVTLNKVFL